LGVWKKDSRDSGHGTGSGAGRRNCREVESRRAMSQDAQRQLKQMRRWVAGLGAVVLAMCGVGTAWFDTVAAVGLVLGGLAGLLGFWLLASRVERLRGRVPARPGRFWFVWTTVRLGLYAAVLLGGWRLDPERLYALMAAAIGLVLMQPVQVAAALLSLERGVVKQNGEAKEVERKS